MQFREYLAIKITFNFIDTLYAITNKNIHVSKTFNSCLEQKCCTINSLISLVFSLSLLEFFEWITGLWGQY
jgi:hypothetical protein